MQLRALDQIHISSVKPDTIRPGEAFEVSDSAGEDLLKKHPTKFSRVDVDLPSENLANQKKVGGDTVLASQKSESAPKNKAEPQPLNKADKDQKNKDDKSSS